MLSAKHERFLEELQIDLNATQAYIRAGYSPNGARQSASELLTNPDIKKRLQEINAERSKRTNIDADRVLIVWERLMGSTLGNYIETPEGEAPRIDITRANADAIYALNEIQIDVTASGDEILTTKTKIKLADRVKASEMVARHLGMFEKDNNRNITFPGALFKPVPVESDDDASA